MIFHLFVLTLLLTLGSCSKPEQNNNTKLTEPYVSTTGVSDNTYQSAKITLETLKQGWTSTGLILASADEATIAAQGAIEVGLPHPFQPKHALWGRVGKSGTIFQLASNQYSFKSLDSGELYIATSPSGLLWANRQGDWVDGFSQMPDAPLDVTVEVFLWTGSAKDGLQQMREEPSRRKLAETSLKAINDKKDLPEGYDYLWYLAQSNVFSSFTDGKRKGVHAKTTDDFGIIKKPLDIPLTPDSQISFDWMYKHLPALKSETDPANHDYLSIALEFDNGQDITWMWSKDLEPETIFKCPLPEWQHRETHIVLQSGTNGLDEWHSHTRSIQKDYAAAVGGKIPARITGVWIIGVSVFGLQQSEALFANAVVVDDGKTHELM
jgi:hypothetical protein